MIRNAISMCLAAALLGALCSGMGCGSGSSSSTSSAATAKSPSSRAYLGTQAPGDVWNWTLTNTTFQATNSTKNYTYAGSASLLNSGYDKLTITATTDPGVAVGAVFYAFEVPNVAIIAKPAGGNSNPIVGASISGCLTQTTVFNWITIPSNGWNATTDNAYGVATLDANTGSLTESDYFISGAPSRTGGFDLTCSDGTYQVTGQPATAELTPAGVMVLDAGPGAGGGIGVEAPANPISLTDLPTHEYRGILFRQAAGNTQLIWARANGSGGIVGGSYTNIEANPALGGEDHTAIHGADVTFTAQNSPGLVNATVTDSGGASPMIMAINVVGGKHMLFGFANEHGSANNFILMEK